MQPLGLGVLGLPQMIGFGMMGLFLVFVAFSMAFAVEQQEASIVERWGRFNRVARAGLNWKIPFAERIAGDVDMRVRQLAVKIETKTKDNVLLVISANVQYQIEQGKEAQWFYAMDNGVQQVSAFVMNVVRAHAPKMSLDEVYEKKDDLADEISRDLAAEVGKFGFLVRKSLIVDVSPDERVAHAMNDINAAQREAVAANARGDAAKTLRVKEAEAEAAAMQLHGEGIANQRKAIASGMKESVDLLRESLPEASNEELTALMLSSQYFDTLKEVAASSQTNTLFLNHAPGAAGSTRDALLEAMKASAPGDLRPADQIKVTKKAPKAEA